MRLRRKISFWLVGLLGALLVRVLISTLRVRVIGQKFPARTGRTGILFCFWHSQLLALVNVYRNRNIHLLVSRHRDGEYIVRVTDRLGYGAVRGSSTRGGIRVLSEALDKLANGVDIAVTPDGPRGPRQEFKGGALFLAKESGAPIVVGALVPARAWRLKSWDRFYVPKPFSRAVLIVSDCVYIPKELSDEEMEAKRLELQEKLNELTNRAEREAKNL